MHAGAAVSFYGGFKKAPTQWEKLEAPILLFYGADDKGVPAEQGHELAAKLRALGKNVEIEVFANANHAFFNDTRPDVYNAEASGIAWRKTLELFRSHL
jgi:carboxymethylenebutenolidase